MQWTRPWLWLLHRTQRGNSCSVRCLMTMLSTKVIQHWWQINEYGALLEWYWEGKTFKCSDKYLSQCHFVHHKSNMNCPGIEPMHDITCRILHMLHEKAERNVTHLFTAVEAVWGVDIWFCLTATVRERRWTHEAAMELNVVRGCVYTAIWPTLLHAAVSNSLQHVHFSSVAVTWRSQAFVHILINLK
jgi:hypothetical protein